MTRSLALYLFVNIAFGFAGYAVGLTHNNEVAIESYAQRDRAMAGNAQCLKTLASIESARKAQEPVGSISLRYDVCISAAPNAPMHCYGGDGEPYSKLAIDAIRGFR